MEANTHPILGREPSVNELQRRSGAVLTPGFFALPNQLKTGDSTYFPSLMTQISEYWKSYLASGHRVGNHSNTRSL